MKTQISKEGHDLKKRFSGVYQQQGRMLTDADWNELVEIIKHRLDDALTDVVGSGTPRHRKLQIKKTGGNWKITPGHVYADGVIAELPGTADISYSAQPDLTSPRAIPADCYVYADVWERVVTALEDGTLMDSALHGADTCSRTKTMLQIKWSDKNSRPETLPQIGDAELTVTIREGKTAPDNCDPCASEISVDSRTGNELFRLEVNDVRYQGNDPTKAVTEVWLKWSSENGAEQCALKDSDGNDIEPPATFKDSNLVYEYFSVETEQNLGVHPKGTPLPLRGSIDGKGYKLPDSGPKDFVRRWDGYCVLKKTGSSWAITEGSDRTMQEFKTSSEVSLTPASGKLKVGLEAIHFELPVNGKKLLSGDYWTVPLRERDIRAQLTKKAETPSYAIPALLNAETPHGVLHHYLELASVDSAGNLVANPEEDRKYAFSPLTEMTRLFMAGGDGQEISPGQPLAQSLRVGVANGEWPVVGATVRFTIESGAGTLALVDGGKTNADGIAQCDWTPGAAFDQPYRVRAALVDPDDSSNTAKDMDPPVYFYANLVSAGQVAYAPQCPPTTANTTHNFLSADSSLPELGADGNYTVKEVLDAVLCALKAPHLPLDKSDPKLCDDLKKNPNINTVQDAIRALCDRKIGGGCAVTVGKGGQYPTLEVAFDKLHDKENISICLLPGTHPIETDLRVLKKSSIKITGCGSTASRIFLNRILVLQATEIVLRDLFCIVGDPESGTGAGNILLAGIAPRIASKCVVDNCRFMRLFEGAEAQWRPLVSIDGAVQVDWRGNNMVAKRRDKRIIEAALPQKNALSGGSLDAYNALKEVFLGNAFEEDNAAFEAKVLKAADKFVALPVASRTKYLKAHDRTLIDALPTVPIRMPVMHLPVMYMPGTAVVAAATAATVAAAPKDEVLGLFSAIKAASAERIKEVVDRIKGVSKLVTTFDDALALTSNSVGGCLFGNVIQGNVILFGTGKDGTASLDWGTGDQGMQKGSWVKGNNFLSSTGVLDMHSNLIQAVHSLVGVAENRTLREQLTSGEYSKMKFRSYESLTVRDNIFLSLTNSFIGKSLNMSGNQFRLGDERGEVVVHAMAYLAVFVGNQALNSDAVAEVVSKEAGSAANLLVIQ